MVALRIEPHSRGKQGQGVCKSQERLRESMIPLSVLFASLLGPGLSAYHTQSLLTGKGTSHQASVTHTILSLTIMALTDGVKFDSAT